MISLEDEKGSCVDQAEEFPARRFAGVAPVSEVDIERRIGCTIAFMKEHLDQPLQASVLAARANFSLSHFFALFKRLTGYTPIDFFIRLKMERARVLLEGTSLKVKEIAAALGYGDPFYFSRVFKLVNGAAPADYRHAHRLGSPAALLRCCHDQTILQAKQSSFHSPYEHLLRV